MHVCVHGCMSECAVMCCSLICMQVYASTCVCVCVCKITLFYPQMRPAAGGKSEVCNHCVCVCVYVCDSVVWVRRPGTLPLTIAIVYILRWSFSYSLHPHLCTHAYKAKPHYTGAQETHAHICSSPTLKNISSCLSTSRPNPIAFPLSLLVLDHASSGFLWNRATQGQPVLEVVSRWKVGLGVR